MLVLRRIMVPRSLSAMLHNFSSNPMFAVGMGASREKAGSISISVDELGG
jgi:hypothetical protein